MEKKKILILGSTGSIGTQTLEVVKLFPDLFEIVGLATNSNIQKLSEQCKKFKVKNVHIFNEKIAETAPSQLQILTGKKGLQEIVEETDFDILVNALSGEIGIEPTIIAVKKGKIIAFANKEALVAKGETIMKLIKKTDAEIRPIDSEHSAIWQCLKSGNKSEIEKIILTCSGGPFRDTKKWPLEKLKKVTKSQALAHPNWNMGPKITIDSATLMNKALEIIEAVRLFEIPPEKIEVVVHPESIIHSAVQYCDGSIIAQMGMPDMRTAIALALSAPIRLKLPFKRFDFFNSKLTFEKPDHARFPSIQLAFKALRKGEKTCEKFNQANEKAVADFLAKKISFLDIFDAVKKSI